MTSDGSARRAPRGAGRPSNPARARQASGGTRRAEGGDARKAGGSAKWSGAKGQRSGSGQRTSSDKRTSSDRRTSGSSRSGPPGRRSGSDERRGSTGRGGERAAPRRPKTAAEERAGEIRARGGGGGPKVQSAPPDRSQEILWVDEGSVRSAAEGAARRGAERDDAQPASTERPRRRRTGALSPDTVGAVERRVGPRRAEKLTPILLEAQVALDRERFGDARRIAASLLPELSKVAEVHEVIGLAAYRLGRWREAANALEASRALGGPPEDMPVLADCYRALRRYAKVDEIWAAIRASSPSPAVMAEGRIVAAGALADRGDLAAAIRAMGSAGDKTRRVREHHLRSWYFLADLYDRSGDALAARELFARVVAHDAEFADVQDRLRALGR